MAGNPNIKVYFENELGEILINEGSRSLGSFSKNIETNFRIYVINSGDVGTKLTIPRSGISLETLSSGFLVNSPTENGPVSINYGAIGQTITFLIDSSKSGNKTITVSIDSNDPLIPKFNYTFSFSITDPLTTEIDSNPDISIVYNGFSYPTESIVNISSVSKNSTIDIPFQIFNYGIGDLFIPQGGITLTAIDGSESLVTDPSSSEGITLSYNSLSTFEVRLDTSSVGTRNVVITISSNDSLKNPFIFSINYSVAEAFDLCIKESSVEVFTEENLSLGSFEKKSIINRNISMSNKGISYGIRLLSFASDGDLTISGIPSLPFVLQPNEKNSLQIVAKLGSSILGKRNASLSVQWEVSS